MKNLSLSRKLITAFLLTGVLPVLIISLIIFRINISVLTNEAENKLISVRESRGFQIEELYKTMEGQVFALSNNQVTVEALKGFEKGAREYSDASKIDIKKNRTKLSEFYEKQFGKMYNESNVGVEFKSTTEFIDKLDDVSVALQSSFISNNENPLGEKDKLFDLNNSTEYASTHSKFHKTFRTYLKTFNYYDIFIVSKESNKVVYSVYKELDFATSLTDGPHAKSGLADAYSKVIIGNKEGEVYITELEKYLPSYDSPAQFISSGIFDNGKLIGALIFQIPVDKINQISTGSNGWKKQGLGDSGEVYLVDKNMKMMSMSRALVENEDSFYSLLTSLGVDQQSLNYVKSKKTSALVVKVDTAGVRKVISGETGFDIFEDYRSEKVLSAFRPLSIKGLDWFILSEMDEHEALASVQYLEKIVLSILAAITVAIAIFSTLLSRGISNKLIGLAGVLEVGSKNLLKSAVEISESSDSLSSATQEQASSLQETSSSISEISAMVERSSDSATYTNDLATSSKSKALEGKQSVSKVRTNVDDIQKNNDGLIKSVEESNKEIEGIQQVIGEIENKTKVINDIVFQTKLLSFNASVEAARAGENGKGFAVVAEEIGALAQMSGKAAAEIAELLTRSTKRVNDSVEMSKRGMGKIIDEGKSRVSDIVISIEQCEEIIDAIVESFNGVTTSVAEIANSAKEQSSGVNEIKQAIQQLDQATQQNTTIAHESSAKADDLKSQSIVLSETVEEIQKLVFGKK